MSAITMKVIANLKRRSCRYEYTELSRKAVGWGGSGVEAVVESYEKVHFLIELPDPIEASQYYMDTHGWSRHHLETCLGNEARVSGILSHQRTLTLAMIRNLNQELRIPAEILIQPYESAQIPA
jgi:HTH-type transcriptional regulator/antitoxin HigA